MNLYCCECLMPVLARLITGIEAYPHRPDLYNIPFWQCPTCLNFVGCHHRTADRTRPLGCIPNREVREARKRVHKAIDPIWIQRIMARKDLYKVLSNIIGREYHTADIRSVKEANLIIEAANTILVEGTA